MNKEELIKNLSNTKFSYLLNIIEGVFSKYEILDYDYKIKSGNGDRIEFRLDLPIYKSVKIKESEIVNKLQLQLRVIDSVDHKVALKVHPVIYSPYNDAYFYLDLKRNVKMTHRGNNFKGEEMSKNFLAELPSEKELREIMDDFIIFYSKLQNTKITVNELHDLINDISDAYFKEAVSRKLKCSKYFQVSKINEQVTSTNNIESEETTLEYLYNCWFECHRPGWGDNLKRAKVNFDKTVKQILK
jgi:hypothetical protein